MAIPPEKDVYVEPFDSHLLSRYIQVECLNNYVTTFLNRKAKETTMKVNHP
jgi:hypothetical protein